MELKTYITTTTDVLGNTYMVIKFNRDDTIDDIVDMWVYEADLTTDQVNHRLNLISNQIERDSDKHHITIISVMDIGKIERNKIERLLGKEVTITLCGIGKVIDTKKNNEAHFIVVESKDLEDVRKDLGLKQHDFHITIGFDKKDVFGQSKAKDSIYHEID